MSGVVTVNAANTRGLVVSRASADSGIQVASTGGSGKTYGITSQTSGVLSIQDDSDGTPRMELNGANVALVGTNLDLANITQTLTASGSAAVPAIAPSVDTDTGLYFSTDAVLVTTGGSLKYTLGSGAIDLPAMDRNTAAGRGISIGRNSDGAFPAAGYLALQAAGGTSYYLWVDATGDLRIHTTPPSQDDGVSDTAGTVVGTQS
jgi:hypothetical protein